MSEENKLKNLDKTRNYLIKEINHYGLISKKYEKVYRVLNYIEHLFILISTITASVYCFCFFS